MKSQDSRVTWCHQRKVSVTRILVADIILLNINVNNWDTNCIAYLHAYGNWSYYHTYPVCLPELKLSNCCLKCLIKKTVDWQVGPTPDSQPRGPSIKDVTLDGERSEKVWKCATGERGQEYVCDVTLWTFFYQPCSYLESERTASW